MQKGTKKKGKKKKKKCQQSTEITLAQEEVNGHVQKGPQEAVHTLLQPRRNHVPCPFALSSQKTQSTQTVVAIATPLCSRVKSPSAQKDYL